MQENLFESAMPVTTQRRTTAVLIANPTSGSYQPNAHNIAETVALLQQKGWDATLELTTRPGDAARITREAVERQIDMVVAIGGDGTLHEIVQELAQSETALGVLPCGTVNVWAREVGIPLDFTGARDVLLHGQRRRIDLGRINNRYFLLMVGIGIDGEVAHAVEKKPVKKLGVLGYLLIGAWFGFHYRPFRVILELGPRAVKTTALQIIIGNTQLYGGAMKYTWQAKCDDGLLDLCVVRKQSIPGRILLLLDFLLHRRQRQQWVRYETEQTIKIHTRKPIAIQVDGEAIGYTNSKHPPTVIKVVPKALTVIVPEVLPDGLFIVQD